MEPTSELPVPPGETPASGGIRPLDEVIRAQVVLALHQTKGNVREAAGKLGIGRSTVYRYIERYEIERYEWDWTEASPPVSSGT